MKLQTIVTIKIIKFLTRYLPTNNDDRQLVLGEIGKEIECVKEKELYRLVRDVVLALIPEIVENGDYSPYWIEDNEEWKKYREKLYAMVNAGHVDGVRFDNVVETDN